MKAEGVIEKFAIGGGIAAIYYLEPYSTEDVDVFVSSTILDKDRPGSLRRYLRLSL